ncbi:heavy metal-associated domain-containing protein [uncultured Ilyobacter sp.]|jgi:copper chaperone CopZ|uniref:heavy metal-associated domain-containing protein n=1 Tax=uncultured Ilyobacter sp. TaxID=544433 RepID=UPI0029F48C38|nr:heavy metal-associated domain-containing protein [uncultured Ilyobacter sp.]
MKKIIIEGMMCGHCENTIEKKLKSIEGIGSVEVSLDEKSAFISGEIEEDLIKKAIEEEGYKVLSIEIVEAHLKEEKEKKGFFSKLIGKIEKSNEKEFGKGSIDCCDLSKQEKEDEEKKH